MKGLSGRLITNSATQPIPDRINLKTRFPSGAFRRSRSWMGSSALSRIRPLWTAGIQRS